MNRLARHQARVLALQALYEWMVSGNAATEIEARSIAVSNPNKVDCEYFRELFLTIVQSCEEIDPLFAPYLDRPIAQLSPIETSILRLATFELSHAQDIPASIIINEAIRLGKEFGSAQGFRYVNAILDRVAKTVRTEGEP